MAFKGPSNSNYFVILGFQELIQSPWGFTSCLKSPPRFAEVVVVERVVEVVERVVFLCFLVCLSTLPFCIV